MRKVVLKLTTQKDLITHESAATTFGELKSEMRQVKWDGMRVVERTSKATLQMDDAVLPQGDFILFLVPEKVKSGKKTSGGADKLSGPIDECKYNELRSHISWLNRNKDAGLDMSGGTDDLKLQLMEYYDNKKSAPKKAEAKPAAKKPAAKAEKAKEYKPTPKQDDEDDEDYEDRIAFEKKAFDKKEKKRLAKLEEERIAKEKKEKEEAEKAAKEKAEKEAADKKAADQKKAPAKKEKKGLFGKKKKEEAPKDPIAQIEEARETINQSIDEIVKNAISGAIAPAELKYTVADLEKEAKQIHSALRTSRSRAKYID